MRWQDFNYQEYKKNVEQFYKDNPDYDKSSKIKDFENFDEYIERVIKLPTHPPKPEVFYNTHGDMLEVFLSHIPFYGKHLTPNLCVYLCTESKEIVGFGIHGVKKMIEETIKIDESINRDFGDENDYVEKMCINCKMFAQQSHSPYCQQCAYDGK